MTDELVYQLTLELIPGIGQRGAKQLISYCGSVSQIFKTPKNRLLKIPGVGSKMADAIKSANSYKEAEEIIRKCENMGIDIIHFTDIRFSTKLKQIYDAPNILYTKGNGELNPGKAISIVGARKSTEYGRLITDKIIAELAATDNITIISGLAYGIDIQAHKAALKHNIPTLAVIAGGLDRIYPSTHKKYANEMLNSGALVSESIPGTKPDAHLFPVRNRIIAGLADATIVVEAAERGGALITANLADSYNRLVFAVPGDVGRTHSVGTNKLIAEQKALIYTGVEDLIYHLGWERKENKAKPENLPLMNEIERVLYQVLHQAEGALEIDLIAIRSNIPVNKVASLLLELEFKNLVKSLPGKKYQCIS